MKKLILNLLFLFFSPLFLTAQNVGISANNAKPHPSAILDIQSKDKGVLIPRVALQGTTDLKTIQRPATSLLIYNTTDAADIKPGFYYFNGTAWTPITAGNITGSGRSPVTNVYWSEGGNVSTNPAIDFIGTRDNVDLMFRTDNQPKAKLTTTGQFELYSINNSVLIGEGTGDNITTGDQNVAIGHKAFHLNTTGKRNSALGAEALYSNTTGNENSANGSHALYLNTEGERNNANGAFALFSNTEGSDNSASGAFALNKNTLGQLNTANGSFALYLNTTGNSNTSNGAYSLYKNTTGSDNTADGAYSLFSNTSGKENVAMGLLALTTNTTGSNNSAIGNNALNKNTTGQNNTAVGKDALYNNTTANYNTASGFQALYRNTTGGSNTAHGYGVLYHNTTGFYNTGNGFQALLNNTTGYYNNAMGQQSLSANTTGNNNNAIGRYALIANKTGSCNTAVGSRAFITGASFSNSTALGCNTNITASNQIRLGSNTVSSIGGFAGWSNVSDARFKVNVKENVAGLDFINALRPVTYNLDMDAIAQFYRTEDDMRSKELEAKKAAIVQTGFLAQEVEEAAQKLGYEFSGVDTPKNEDDHYALRYAEFTVPLVKAVQELSKENEQLKSEIATLKKVEAQQQAMQTELAEIKALLKSTVSK